MMAAEVEPGILHVDMDAFFASCELARRPELRGRPVYVGGGERGVVLAASYEARAYGVHSAMPSAQAQRLCPQAVVLPADHREYSRVSHGVMDILRDVTPLVEQISVDEAFLDVTGARRRLGSPSDIAEAIRRRVRGEYKITCSVGIAPTKSVAKIASGAAKPDGVLCVGPGQVLDFLHPLPVTKLWGVGGKASEALSRYGIATIGELAHSDLGLLRRALGEAMAAHLYNLAWGRDSRPVVVGREEKSIGNERTFPHDICDEEQLRRYLMELADRAASRLRQERLACRTVGVKIKFADFSTISRSRTLAVPTDVTRQIFDTARLLFGGVSMQGKAVRLLGVRLENVEPIEDLAIQASFDDLDFQQSAMDHIADNIREKFGSDAVRSGSLVMPDMA